MTGWWWRRKQREEDLDRELRADLDLEAAEQQERGVPRDEARHAARRALGNTARVKEDTRDTWGWTSLERLVQDLRYGIRTLRRNPGFALAAVLTLALGIGANTAMFSVIYGVLLRPLPYVEANRLALVNVHFYPQDTEYGTMSIADYLDWKARNRAFEDPAIFSNASWRFDLTGAGEPVEVKGCAVSGNFFSVLRSGPALGRVFDSDDSSATAAHVVVLNNRLWRNQFRADPAVIGRPVTLNGDAATVIGVMPTSFDYPEGEELWTNIRLRPPTRRGPFPYIGIARLKPGITLAQAQRETNAIGHQIEQANPGSYRRMTMPVRPLRDAVAGKAGPALLVMLGAVFLVLLIATANVANLTLVRSSARERELAVRLSLGAMRMRLVRQLLTESVLLAGGGGLVGLALAWFGIAALRALNPGNLPRIEDVHLDIRVVGFTFVLSLLTGVAFGLAPAFRSSSADLNGALRRDGRTGTASAARRRTHHALAIAEVALSFTLLIGGGLLLRSLIRLQDADAGFQAPPEQVLTVAIAPGRRDSSNPHRYQRILDRVSSLPGVESAALSDSLPPDRRNDYDTFQIEGQPWSQSAFPAVTTVIVSRDYFRALHVPLLRGRYFTEADSPHGAIIVSESLARRYFGSSSPVGHRFAPSGPDNHNDWLPITGVVADVKYTGLDAVSEPAYYELYTDSPEDDGMKLNLVVRSSIATSLLPEIEHEIRAVDPNATLSDPGTLQTARSASVAQPRFRALLISGFGAIALLLSAIGIYGVIAYSVAQRVNEIGIRMALGAQRSTVLRQIVRNGAALALVGVLIGCGGALIVTRALAGLLFGTSSTDPLTFAAVALTLMGVAVLASLIPAVRATRIDPVMALRHE